MDSLNKDIFRVLIDERTIEKRVRELGSILSKEFEDKNPVLICVLRGAVVFLTELMKCMTIPLEIDFIAVSSYGDSTTSSGVVKIKKDLDIDIKDRHIILVEDIIDTGFTLMFLQNHLRRLQPKSITNCALLDKPSLHKTEVKVEYIGFVAEEDFYVGYGLDYAERYRNLPYIGVLKEEIYK
ncbi:MAG: hypoxanthine phosphoribosyltransferase [Candidatus Cloacimonetes bacterium]|nr:hypoxanthine phosphoribosyltransferase [Candidatus Cloacimonadota bacterium]